MSWGFLTQVEEEQDRPGDFREWFKVFFDETEYNKARSSGERIPYLPPTHAHVKKYYRDFLRKLYPQIKTHLQDNVRNWNTANIEFLFSVPTTWTKLSLTTEFKQIAMSAGFGRDGSHRVDVSLTEAEAAAVHTFNSQNALYEASRL